MSIVKKAMKLDADTILELVGLERKNSALGSLLPAIGLLMLGATVGAGLGLMFAPSSGRTLRQGVGGKLDKIRERVKSEIDSKPSTATANSHHA
jgi:hypothetical protein